jgi:ribose transport system permease protein
MSAKSERAVHALGQPAARDEVRTTLKRVLSRSYLFLVLLATIAVGHLVSPNFLTVRNASNVVAFSSIIALLAVGQFYVILSGGIDLSVGAVLALSTVVAALLLRTGMDAFLASVLTLTACGAVGLCTGLIVVWLGITPFIATLAMMSMAQALATSFSLRASSRSTTACLS